MCYRGSDELYDRVDARVTRLPPSMNPPAADNKDVIRKALASSSSGGSVCRQNDHILQLDSKEVNAVLERYVY